MEYGPQIPNQLMNEPDVVVVHICNSSTWEAGAGGSGVQDQCRLYIEFEASLVYIFGPCFKKKKIHIYIYIQRQRDKEGRKGEREKGRRE
jgi:hypothetical protein